MEQGMAATESEGLVGQTLGGVRLDHLLAKGLLADVYLGFHANLKTQVAVKILSPKVASQGMSAERFMREGRALAKLVHPNIVKIHNVGVEQGKYFIVMDFIKDGANLRALAKKQFLKPYQSLIVARRLAEALEYIHGQGLIHRDIKPANICLRQNGQPILMDFSLIKDESSDIQLTAPGTIMGTVNFMPPEQAQPGGPFGKVTNGSDVYSLGATFYWLLTGRAPFKGRTPMETIIKLIRDAVVPPSQLNPSVPAELDELCLKCLAKNPAQRFKTAREFIQAIDEAVSRKRAELQNATAPVPETEAESGRSEKPSAASPAKPKEAWGAGSGEATPPAAAPAPAAWGTSGEAAQAPASPPAEASPPAPPPQAPPPQAPAPAPAPTPVPVRAPASPLVQDQAKKNEIAGIPTHLLVFFLISVFLFLIAMTILVYVLVFMN